MAESSVNEAWEHPERPVSPPLSFAPQADDDDDDGGANLLGDRSADVDYYAVLNVPKTATSEEIRRAYLRLSRTLHPDKRGTGGAFLRISRAYEVLMDEQKRMVYDLFGEKGLETSWAMAETLKTPEEMMREFHRLEQLKKEEEEAAATRLEGQILVNVNACDVVRAPADGSARELAAERVMISQSVSSRISRVDTLELEGFVLAQNGMGTGEVAATLKRQVSASTRVEACVGNVKASASVRHQLSDEMFVETAAMYTDRGPMMKRGSMLAVMVGRYIAEDLLATARFTFGMYESVEVAVASVGQDGNAFRVAAEAAPNDLKVNVKAGHLFSRASTGIFKVGASLASGLSVGLGAERMVSRRTKVGLELSLSAADGVTLEIEVRRAGFAFTFPFLLSARFDVLIAAAAAAVPSAIVAALKAFVINPNKARRKARRIGRIRRERMAETMKRAAEVAETMASLAPQAEEKRQQERATAGLVIDQAWYGNIEGVTPHIPSPLFPQYIDVANQLQLLVERSSLSLPDSSKADTLSFYDCCPGEAKQLFIRYTFQAKLHEVLVDDLDPLAIPDPAHRIDDPAVTIFHPVAPADAASAK